MGNSSSSPTFNFSGRSQPFKHNHGQGNPIQQQPSSSMQSSSQAGTSTITIPSSSAGKSHAHEYLTKYEWTPERIRAVVQHWSAYLIRDLERDKQRHFQYLGEMTKQCDMAQVTALTASDEQLEQSFCNLQMLQACLSSGHEVSDKLQRRLQWAKNARDVIGLILSNEHAFYDGSLKDLLVALGLIDSSGTYVITIKERGDKDTPPRTQPDPLPAPPAEADVAPTALTCEICMENPRSCLLLPCKHWKFCNQCIKDYQATQDERGSCPQCREPIKSIIYDVYM